MKYVITLSHYITTTQVSLLEKRYGSNLGSYASNWSVVIKCFRVSECAMHAFDAKHHLVTFIQGHGPSCDCLMKAKHIRFDFEVTSVSQELKRWLFKDIMCKMEWAGIPKWVIYSRKQCVLFTIVTATSGRNVSRYVRERCLTKRNSETFLLISSYQHFQ